MISFFLEDIDFDIHSYTLHVPRWLEHIALQHHYSIKELNYIFCSDHYLLDINRQFLHHDYFTDILTFNNSEEAPCLEADIFISINRVQDNATHFHITFENELLRVMVHGLLHLIGFDDSSEPAKSQIRMMEDQCLQLYFQSFKSN